MGAGVLMSGKLDQAWFNALADTETQAEVEFAKHQLAKENQTPCPFPSLE